MAIEHKTHSHLGNRGSSDLLEHEALDESRLRRDVATAEKNLERVNEDLEKIKEDFTPHRPDSEIAVRIKDLIPVIDLLDKEIDSEKESFFEVRNVMKRARQKLLELLEENGVKVEDSVGQTYNPGCHRLHCLESDATKKGNAVLKVVEQGYRCGDEVFRPAKVIVNVLDEENVGDGS